MNVNGTEANTLLAAQLASQQRQPAQEAASQAQRDQSLQVRDAALQGAATQAPQTASGLRAVETEDSGRGTGARRDLPRDAQGDAREALNANGERPSNGPLQRGAVVDIIT